MRKDVKVLIVCGSGIATSTMVAVKVKEMLAAHGINAEVKQAAVNTYQNDVKNFDLIVSTSKINPPIPMVIGISYITGRNIEETNQQILKIISELPEK